MRFLILKDNPGEIGLLGRTEGEKLSSNTRKICYKTPVGRNTGNLF